MLSKRLKVLRGSKTQNEVADALGISRARYSHYENDHVEPDIQLLIKMANYFNTTIDDLLGNKADLYLGEIKPQYGTIQESPVDEILDLLNKHNLNAMSFFDIKKWEALKPEQIRELVNYFNYLVQQAKENEKEGNM
ncbi:helix-turn-helix domain-containing protein [Pseudalkalibacillus hwajinpoensis]|uniref:helix-turn-helix domain-containing protein n=1 Tax=Guptibacillus hwajinpoensis TaxID=208199 RepID=UPI00325B7C78